MDARLEGLTGKARKNMRKKLQRQRKKARENSTVKGSEMGDAMKDISNKHQEGKRQRVPAGSMDFSNVLVKGVLDGD